jgi:hypothetical protein
MSMLTFCFCWAAAKQTCSLLVTFNRDVQLVLAAQRTCMRVTLSTSVPAGTNHVYVTRLCLLVRLFDQNTRSGTRDHNPLIGIGTLMYVLNLSNETLSHELSPKLSKIKAHLLSSAVSLRFGR